MTLNKKSSEILNDLIQVNNDRITGYEKAAEETEVIDADLRAIFQSMIAQSRQNVAELTRYVQQTGTTPETGTTLSGKIYRAWMDVKATFSGNDRKTILDSCEYGEDVALKAYKDALVEEGDERLSQPVREMITEQKNRLLQSHDRIRMLRDTEQEVSGKDL